MWYRSSNHRFIVRKVAVRHYKRSRRWTNNGLRGRTLRHKWRRGRVAVWVRRATNAETIGPLYAWLRYPCPSPLVSRLSAPTAHATSSTLLVWLSTVCHSKGAFSEPPYTSRAVYLVHFQATSRRKSPSASPLRGRRDEENDDGRRKLEGRRYWGMPNSATAAEPCVVQSADPRANAGGPTKSGYAEMGSGRGNKCTSLIDEAPPLKNPHIYPSYYW